MEVIKQTSTKNTCSLPNRQIKYLVIHYTAGATSRKGSARNTAAYFNSGADASADYIVDDYELVQYNPDPYNRYTYAVGKDYGNPGGKFYGNVNNRNSISLEVCSTNIYGKYTNNYSDYYFTDAVVAKAIEATKYLMKLYNIDIDHVCTHREARGKYCPAVSGWGALGGDAKWQWFKKQLIPEVDNMTKQDVKDFVELCSNEQAYALLQKAMKYTNELEEPDWSKAEGHWERATTKGMVNGRSPESFIKRDEVLAILGRAGVLG